ncbi:hypothetical protein V8G54_018162 [Vigna mungo]|uniref:Uncharacterized protein n=1 Tax=Vigna mungo TaxID=3915 RepID=A0AAQ3RUH1_VIGMU
MSQPTASRAARRNSISPTRSTTSRAPSACTTCDMQAAAGKPAHMMIVQAAAAAPDSSEYSSITSDFDHAADDFWREIKLPELLHSKWWTSSANSSPWTEDDLSPPQPFTTVCL